MKIKDLKTWPIWSQDFVLQQYFVIIHAPGTGAKWNFPCKCTVLLLYHNKPSTAVISNIDEMLLVPICNPRFMNSLIISTITACSQPSPLILVKSTCLEAETGPMLPSAQRHSGSSAQFLTFFLVTSNQSGFIENCFSNCLGNISSLQNHIARWILAILLVIGVR